MQPGNLQASATGPQPTLGAPPAIGDAASRAAAEFERMVVAQMLRQFTAGALRADEAASPFATMLQDAYAAAIADSGRIGIAGSLLRVLSGAGGRP